MENDRGYVRRTKTVLRWLKQHPAYTILGIIGTVFSVVKGAPPAWDAFTEMAGLPSCLTSATVYRYPSGYFEKSANRWIEHGVTVDFNFVERSRNRDYIMLLNLTPRQGNPHPMILRLPVCGGTAQWSYENPLLWTDLFPVWPASSGA